MNYDRLFLCPSTCLRHDGVEAYLYRYRDGKCWDPSLLEHPLAWRLFSLFCKPLSLEEATNEIQDFSAENVSHAISSLFECDLLLKEGDSRFSNNKIFNMLNFSDENFFYPSCYHLHTSNIEKIDYSDAKDVKENDSHMMKEYVRNETAPSNFHRALRSSPSYYLSAEVPFGKFKHHASGDLAFSHQVQHIKQDISIDTLNFLINMTYAQIGSVQMIGTGEHLRKCVPSGGARHPVEVYVIVSDVYNIDSGVYHYNVKNHRLDKIDLPHVQFLNLIKCVSILPNVRQKRLKIGFINTCQFARSMFRYREPRSYRVMHYDLGHIHANLSICSRILGINFSSSYSLPENAVESILLLDPFWESVMSCFGIFEECCNV